MSNGNDGTKMTNGPEQARSFEASLEALEQIVQQLESGDLPLEKSLELFEQGVRLSRECQERLSQAERRIEVLLRDNQGRPVVNTDTEPTNNDGVAENENGL
jgi:exodeoxyribonuclease VII small subunit